VGSLRQRESCMHSRVRARWIGPAVATGILCVGICGRVAAAAEERSPDPAEIRLRNDVSFLAHDEREGRAPGTAGIESAADYIAAAFKTAGLKTAPGAEGYFQVFTLGGVPTIRKAPELTLSGPGDKVLKADPKVDFTPLAIGTGGTIAGTPVVFAGYGITAK